MTEAEKGKFFRWIEEAQRVAGDAARDLKKQPAWSALEKAASDTQDELRLAAREVERSGVVRDVKKKVGEVLSDATTVPEVEAAEARGKKEALFDRARSAFDSVKSEVERVPLRETFDRLKESETVRSIKSAAEKTGQRLRESAEGFRDRAKDAAGAVPQFLGMMERAQQAPEERDAVVASFLDWLPKIVSELDEKAQAVAFGQVGESGAGWLSLKGFEFRYVRAQTPTLVLVELSGRAARLSAGVSTHAYVASYYGPEAALCEANVRRGGDAGALVASMRCFRFGPFDRRLGTGWMLALGAALNLGVPILSDISGFELKEVVRARYPLYARERERAEEIMTGAKDRERLRAIAQAFSPPNLEST